MRYDRSNLPEYLLKLHTDANAAMNTVTAYGAGFVQINTTRFEHAIVFAPLGDVTQWPAKDPSDISTDLLMQAARLTLAPVDPLTFLDEDEDSPPAIVGERPEVLLVGTGSRQQMLAHSVTQPLLRIGVGIEVMSTPAAARTYNILMSEGRRVIAALLTP